MNRCAILLCAFIVIGLEKAEAASFPIANFAFSQELSHSMSGNEVSELQSALTDMGYAIPSIESGRVRKGYFGLETQAALKIYQRGVGLPETGVLDEMTRMYMNEGVTYGTSIPLNTNAPIAPIAPATSTMATSTEPVPQDTEVEINITSPGDINSLQKGKFQEISWSFEDHGKFSSTSTPQVDIHLIADAPQASTSAPLIASGIDARRGSYPWQAGNVLAFGADTSTRPTAVPD